MAPVLTALLDDELAAGDAVAALRRYSLVAPAGDGSVSVHRLVQAVTADQMPAELAGQWRHAAAALIEAAIPADPYAPKTWPTCVALLPHAQAALPFAALLPVDERVLGSEHPDTLTARHNLARWTGETGDAAGARDLYAALLPVNGRVLGPEHPDTLTARHNLAYWTDQAERGPRRA